MAEQKKLSLIAFSGDFDKLTAVFTLATGAAAVGYEVNIFFTFWGLDAIKQKRGRSFIGGNWLTKLFGFMMGGLSVAPNSKFNFEGAVRSFALKYPDSTIITVPESPMFNFPQANAFTAPRLEQMKAAGGEYSNDFTLTEQTLSQICSPMIPEEIYAQFANGMK